MPRSTSADDGAQRLAAVRCDVLDLASPVHRFLCGVTGDPAVADDLTQDTMLRAWQAARTLKDAARVRGWVFTIAANAARSHQRRKRRLSWIPLERFEEMVDPHSASAECGDLVTCLGRLAAHEREVVLLVAHAGFNVPEAAEILGISTAAAEKRWQRGRDRLRRLLEGERP